MNILCATSDVEIAACFRTFQVLRPHLLEAEFVTRVRRQIAAGYQMIFVKDSETVVAAAGYRILEFLATGRVLYVDDLITLPEKRGAGYGGGLMDWLIARGLEQGCDELHLDSGYQRTDAHRLYLNKGLQLSCHHLSLRLKSKIQTA